MRTRRNRRDDGAVLVIVAAFSIVAILFLAFVIDIGNQRQNRRQLTTQTDSVALAVAQDWADNRLSATYDCDTNGGFDEALAISNSPVSNASPDYECEFDSIGRRRGVVTVWDRETVNYDFGGFTGVDEGRTGALTRARVMAAPGGGLRPLALCALEPQLAQWLLEFSANVAPSQDTITFDKDGVGCGGSSGNWGLVQVPGAGNGQNEWRDVVLEGAPEDAAVGDLLPPQTGIGMNSAEDVFDQVRITEPIFHLPVYQNNPGLPPGGPGNNARYQVLGFLEVELIDFEANGSTADLTIRPLSYDASGPCCNITPFNAQYAICDVGTIGGVRDSSVDSACLPPFTPPVIPDLEDPAPDPVCAASSVAKIAPAGSVTLTNGNPKYTEQEAVFDITFEDLSQCSNLTFQIEGFQGNTQILRPMTADAPSGDIVRIRLAATTELPGSGTYAVQVLEDSSPLPTEGTLIVSQN